MQIKPDLSRIASYTLADDGPKPTTIRCYSNGQQNLFYINASHVRGTDNATCAKIEEAITYLKPQRVVIEACNDQPINEGSEVAYANTLAAQYNIPLVRAEPSDKAVFDNIGVKGYSAKDVMALYLLRSIPQGRQQGYVMDEPHFAERARQFLSGHPAFAHIPASERLSYEEFKAKYVPLLGKNFLETTTNDFAPFEHEGATYFQKLNAAVGWIREAHIDTTIGNTLNEVGADNVLVVYGGAHRTISEPVWEHALGKGADVSPIQEATGIPYRNDWTLQPRNQQGRVVAITRSATN
ncbi:MAG: hypothetical protein ACKVOE_07800 [Rickettsiales bacterium]